MSEIVRALLDMGADEVTFARIDGCDEISLGVRFGRLRFATKYRGDEISMLAITEWLADVKAANAA